MGAADHAHVNDFIYEQDYAREMLFTTIRHRADGTAPTRDITALVNRALDAGCGTTELIMELAGLGALLFDAWSPDNHSAALETLGRDEPASLHPVVELW